MKKLSIALLLIFIFLSASPQQADTYTIDSLIADFCPGESYLSSSGNALSAASKKSAFYLTRGNTLRHVIWRLKYLELSNKPAKPATLMQLADKAIEASDSLKKIQKSWVPAFRLLSLSCKHCPDINTFSNLHTRTVQYCINNCKYNYEDNAIPMFRLAIDKSVELGLAESILESYTLLVRFYLHKTDYFSAAKLHRESAYAVESIDSDPKADSLLGRYYFTMGNIYERSECYSEAIACYTQSLPLLEKSGDIQGLVSALMDIVESIRNGNYDISQCDYYLRRCSEVIAEGETAGKYSVYNWAKFFDGYAKYMSSVKHHDEALAYIDSAVWLFDKHLDVMGQRNKNFNRYKFLDIDAYYLRKKIPILSNMGNGPEIDNIAQKCKAYQLKENLDDWGRVFVVIANYYFGLHQMEKAREFYDMGAEFFYKHAQGHTADSYECMMGSLNCDIALKIFDKEKIKLLEATVDSVFPTRNTHYVDFVEKTAFIEFKNLRDTSRFVSSLVNSTYTMTRYLEQNFLNLDNQSFQSLWKKIDISCSRALVANQIIKDDDLAKRAYQYTLLQKNINYISQNSLRNYDYNSKEKLNKILTLEFSQARDMLGDKELAVEFTQIFKYDPEFTYAYPHKCDYAYFAIAFTKESEHPEIIQLFTEEEFNSFTLQNGAKLRSTLENRTSDNILQLYTDTTLTNLILGKITSKFNDINTMFISPTGLLHSIAIENLSMGNSKRVSDKYKIVRIASTANINSESNDDKFESFLALGDINYSTDLDTQVELSEKHFPKRDTRFCQRCNINCRLQPDAKGKTARSASSLAYRNLASTREECEYIERKFGQESTTLLSGDNATEECFKAAISQGKYDVVHFATHGYYGATCDKSRKELLNSSALILSGANNYINRQEIPSSVDDGFLTAQEISELDLTHTKLAVLSACETGLGFVNSDGLFGLERGFKLAGVKSILISLWNISDEATSLFLRKFYNRLHEGYSPRESLRYARDYMRQGNRFCHPFYWAGFVIVE